MGLRAEWKMKQCVVDNAEMTTNTLSESDKRGRKKKQTKQNAWIENTYFDSRAGLAKNQLAAITMQRVKVVRRKGWIAWWQYTFVHMLKCATHGRNCNNHSFKYKVSDARFAFNMQFLFFFVIFHLNCSAESERDRESVWWLAFWKSKISHMLRVRGSERERGRTTIVCQLFIIIQLWMEVLQWFRSMIYFNLNELERWFYSAVHECVCVCLRARSFVYTVQRFIISMDPVDGNQANWTCIWNLTTSRQWTNITAHIRTYTEWGKWERNKRTNERTSELS